MATYRSIINLKGRIGDLVYRRYYGKNYVGMLTGPTAEQVLTAPEFINTRKNMAEFGACANYADDIVKAMDERYTMTSGKKFKGQRKIISKLLKLRKLDTINPFGQRVINGNEALKEIVIEKKGNFNFDFIKLKSVNLFQSSTEVEADIRFYFSDIRQNVPNYDEKTAIRLSISMILAPRKIFNTITNKYEDYRENLIRTSIPSKSYKTLNLVIAENTQLEYSLQKPVIGQPTLNTGDYFTVILQYAMMRLNPSETAYIKTENYITKILFCEHLDI